MSSQMEITEIEKETHGEGVAVPGQSSMVDETSMDKDVVEAAGESETREVLGFVS
jgi:hypothetical protein